MVSRAGPGGFPSHSVFWSDLVSALVNGFESIMYYVQRLIYIFTSPFSELIDNDTGVSFWFLNLIQWVLDFFGVEFLDLTPLEFMLGTTLPIIILFTVYRYIKQ